MKKMRVALFSLKFNADEAVNTVAINLPKCAEILSASVQSEIYGPYILVSYMAPSEYLDFDVVKTWCEFQFTIVRCRYQEFEFDNHNYIATIKVGNDAFAIFYKKAK